MGYDILASMTVGDENGPMRNLRQIAVVATLSKWDSRSIVL